MRRLPWLLVLLGGLAQAATFSIIDKDDAGEGLNDPTPFVPVGGNSATTLGQARLNVLIEAGRIWGAQLGSSVPIVVDASFDSLTPACTPTTGTLGSAGAHYYFTLSNSPYLLPAALADSLNGQNNGQNGGRDDIFAQFNSDVRAGNTGCLGGNGFYLGFDHASGQGIDLLAVVLHEFGHGLGFVSLVNADGTGANSGTQLSAFDQYVYSESQGKFWPTMTAAERAASITDSGKLVFNSPSVNAVLSQLTGGLSNPGGHLRLYAPTTYSDGSSISHWDLPADWVVPGSNCAPGSLNVDKCSLLMEPFITRNPLGSTDVTGCVLKDMGWVGTRCPDSRGVPPNQPPQASAQTVTTMANTAVSITLAGSDPEGSALSFAVVATPAHGTLSGTAPDLSYTPNAGYTGTDSFTFRVNDGQLNSADAAVTITISAPPNQPPVANAQTVSTATNAAVNITLAGTDPEGSALSFAVVATPAHGTLSGSAPNLTYTPNASFSGTDSFTFRVNDGQLNSADAAVTINISGPPSANAAASTGGGGGGGEFDGLALGLLLLLLGIGRVPLQCTRPTDAHYWGNHEHPAG